MTPARERLRAIALICTLQKSPATSSSDRMADQLLERLRKALRQNPYPPYE